MKKRQHPEGAKTGHRITAIKNLFKPEINKITTAIKTSFYKAIKTIGPSGLVYGTSKSAVSGIQSGNVKYRNTPMPGLTTRIKELVQGGDSTFIAGYKKWLGNNDPRSHGISDYNYMLRQKKKNKNK